MPADSHDSKLTPAAAAALAARAGDDPAALLQIARLVAAQDAAMARRLARRARELAPGDGRIRVAAAELVSREVAHWHFTIVGDERRNRAYDDAIRRAVTPGSRVLDIGAGSGLLAMMAARAGAAAVTSCEMNGAVAEAAAEIVAANGMADRVTVIASHSTALTEAEIGGRADVLVSETISNDVVAQHWLAALEDARARLLTEDARVIPARTIARVALAWDDRLNRERMGEVDGFDLSGFNALARGRYQVRADAGRISLRSAPADLFDFDFQNGRAFPAASAAAALTADGGAVNGLVQWIAIGLDAETWYENAPGKASCWAPLFYPLEREIAPAAGTRLTVRGSHDRSKMLIWLE